MNRFSLETVLALFLLLVLQLQATAQTDSQTKERILEQIAESLAAEASDESDLSTLIDDLERLSYAPLDLNRATREQLEQLPFLNATQINNLLIHIRNYGQLFSLNELAGVDGFNDETIRFLEPFTQLGAVESGPRKTVLNETNLRMGQNLEKVKGFMPNDAGERTYPGIDQKIYLRHKTTINQAFNLGLTAETDTGEYFFKENNRTGFDYYSGYAQYQGNKLLRNVILGDFQVKMGQGLIQWSGYGMRKSAETARVRYMGQGIRPYTSTDENASLRGVASHVRLGSIDLMAFYSNKRIDANVSAWDETGKPSEVSSLLTTGYHRTANERADEDVLREQLAGLSGRFTRNNFSAAVNANMLDYSLPFMPANKPYNEFRFRGTSNYDLSTDWTYMFNKISFFGEAALSKSNGKALLTGIEAQPANEFSYTLLYRNYQRNFQSIKGSAFSEGTTITNEQGIYSSFVLFPMPKVRISGYLDAYEFPWIKYTSAGPVRGTDMQLQINYRPIRRIEIYGRIKNEQNAEKTRLTSTIKSNADQNTRKYRLNAQFNLNEHLTLKLRSEWSAYEKDDSLQTGLLLMGDVDTHFFENKLGIQMRLAWYDTDGYNARIYAYENDMPFLFSIPAYYGKGIRTYMKINYKISRQLTVYARYARTQLQPGDTFGSGNDTLDSNIRSDVKIHLKYRF
jgi:hypothetical protein